MNINWYPGHMKKTRELLQSNLKLVDIVIELLDARIPLSSKNPDIDKIINNKPRLVVMNKSDLSSEKTNKEWKEYFNKNNTPVVFIDATNNKGVDSVSKEIQKTLEQKMQQRKERGIKNTSIRAMIVGIPNVGKSTIINSLAGKKSAKTGNRPGVTKSKQWIKLRGDIELLDTPGILWPKFEDKEVALNLAFTGAIKDEILDTETLALKLVERLCNIEPSLIENRYNIEVGNSTPLEVMESIAEKRGCIVKGGEVDYTRVSSIILDEFRKGVIGKITLENPK